MKPREPFISFVAIAIIAIAATALRPAHSTQDTTAAGSHASEPAAAGDGDSITYYLLNKSELRTLAAERSVAEQSDELTAIRVAPKSVVAIVAGAVAESRLRHTIDEANSQVAAFGEPGFRIVDLRPSAPVDGDGPEGSSGSVLGRSR